MSRYEKKTSEILYHFYRETRDVEILSGRCLGCGLREGEWGEKSPVRVYCQPECQRVYHDFFLPLGGKRLIEEDRERGGKAVDFPQFMRLLELVDESIAPSIITFAYPHYREDPVELKIILNLRSQSKQLKRLIEEYVLKPIKKLSERIMRILTQTELTLFPNLTALTLYKGTEIFYLGGMTQLETLDISEVKIIRNNSLRHLTNLTSLHMDATPYINYSLKNLTKLETLELMENNTTITDEILTALQGNLTTFMIYESTLLHDVALKTLTNLTALDINGCHNITDSGIQPLVKLSMLNCSNCEWIESWGLSQMKYLSALVANDCRRFTGAGFAFNIPLEVLSIQQCPDFIDTSFDFAYTLKQFLFDGTNVSDKALRYATNIKNTSILDTALITDETVSTLTKLEYFMLQGETPNITRKSLSQMTNLKALVLFDNSIAYDPTIEINLPELIQLNAMNTGLLRDVDLVHSTRIIHMNLEANSSITGEVFQYLTNIEVLNLSRNEVIRSESLTRLTNLKILVLYQNTLINGDLLSGLTNLEKIVFFDKTAGDDYRFINLVRELALRGSDESDSDDEIREVFVIDEEDVDEDGEEIGVLG